MTISQQFNPLSAFETRNFSADFKGNRDGIGADRARLMCWADDAPFFLQGAVRHNACANSAVIERFLNNTGSIVALTPTDAFRSMAGISQSGAIGAMDTTTGKIYLDASWQNNKTVRVAARLFARAQKRNQMALVAAA